MLFSPEAVCAAERVLCFSGACFQGRECRVLHTVSLKIFLSKLSHNELRYRQPTSQHNHCQPLLRAAANHYISQTSRHWGKPGLGDQGGTDVCSGWAPAVDLTPQRSGQANTQQPIGLVAGVTPSALSGAGRGVLMPPARWLPNSSLGPAVTSLSARSQAALA